ncbi:YhfC family glutamic-type intramembrane protease [Alkalihalobacillus pseudalcaliphilus]|uniref:YhfC family glutamic-type intramembrane protease n=1 Tax=Alkalihalobacillus pseudalcaliphilus TaxID=79884 RepID=UPI00064DD8BE|nr:YhfC family glutamic-type intramembrane protease [Alkalihalobacillus pseudalcaliphilus]KMK75610.1 hypothetical protein AB990_10000 [Alkalihalobacillus pseudalcaliphilus]
MIAESIVRILTISVYAAIVIPIILILVAKLKFKVSMKSLLFGMLAFLLFSQILMNVILTLFFSTEATRSLFGEGILYVLIIAITGAVVVEIGRFLTLKYMLKKERNEKAALGFGVGFSSLETVLVLGFTSVSMLTAAVMMNEGLFEDQALADQLMTVSTGFIVFGVLEQLFSIVVHIALSLFILYAIASENKKYVYYAIAFHIAFAVPGLLYQQEIITSLVISQLMMAVIALCTCWLAKRYYQELKTSG